MVHPAVTEVRRIGPTERLYTCGEAICHALYYEGGGWYTLLCEWVVSIAHEHTAQTGTVTCLLCLGHRSVEDRRVA